MIKTISGAMDNSRIGLLESSKSLSNLTAVFSGALSTWFLRKIGRTTTCFQMTSRLSLGFCNFIRDSISLMQADDLMITIASGRVAMAAFDSSYHNIFSSWEMRSFCMICLYAGKSCHPKAENE